jgi:hypothetical protein
MRHKLTTEQFIEKAKLVHGDTFDYSKVNYTDSKIKVTITCKIHGDFEQKPNSHISSKQGCMKCTGSEKLTNITFIEKANKVHDNIYDYSKIEYKNNKIEVLIICKKHGEFKQKPNSHISSRHGCPKCAGTEKLNTEIFVKKAKLVHGNLYDYSLVEYKNNKTPLTIICNIHGEFNQNSNSHISSMQGCPTCGGTEKLITTSFIEKSNSLHCGLYSYDNTEYVNSKTKIIITCPIHGDFSQDPSSHLQKVGCPTCSQGYYSIKRAERHIQEWNKIPAILYFLKIKTNEEEFYKIGLTKKTIDKRFNKDNFKIHVLKEYHTNLYNACILEAIILEENKKHKYEPKAIFGGHTECFNKNILE